MPKSRTKQAAAKAADGPMHEAHGDRRQPAFAQARYRHDHHRHHGYPGLLQLGDGKQRMQHRDKRQRKAGLCRMLRRARVQKRLLVQNRALKSKKPPTAAQSNP